MADSPANNHWIETYKSLINLSIEGFKFAALANGGAAVALLAYLGNVAGKVCPLPNMQAPMLAFLAGLACCGFSMFFAYVTQLRLFNERTRSVKPFAGHTVPLYIAMLLYVSSLVAFGAGSWLAVIRFQ